ncbi:MAG: SpoIID/LytB domain-containing protein [Caldithrix sp.]|nr:SpoIID/LytB domain-containing protein [Caldithrix sp.]
MTNTKIEFKTLNEQPAVDVCILRNQQSIEFEFNPQKYSIVNLDNAELFTNLNSIRRFYVKTKISKAAIYEYYLLLKSSPELKIIKEAKRNYVVENLSLHIQETGGDIYLSDQYIFSNNMYHLLGGPFWSEQEARHHSSCLNQLTPCSVYRKQISKAEGVVEIFDRDCDYVTEVANGFKLLSCEDAAYFKLLNISYNKVNEELTVHEDLFFHGNLNVTIDEHDCLCAVNRVNLDQYLQGVICSEMSETVAEEFAKSMAIVTRSQVFSRMSQLHAEEPFDFCNDGHCLRYFGRKVNNPIIIQAVKHTKGLVLEHNGRVLNTYFNYSCGGHTETPSGVWDNNDCSYLTSKPDHKNKDGHTLDLSTESGVNEWILSRPNVYCKDIPKESAYVLKDAADAFRWEVFYTRNELENLLYEKTGQDVGLMYEILPIKRGSSGRIKELDILGSLKNINIKGELNIRSALAPGLLNSSCFFVRTETDQDGVPINFYLIGAGKGHGIGLCKSGAAAMAKEHKTAKEIIKHYFEKCNINRIYSYD